MKNTQPNNPINAYSSPEEISQLGEKFYFDQLKDKLEKGHSGEYVVIDVSTNNSYVINLDKLAAIEEARKKFGNKLFYIVQVGSIQKPAINFRDVKYAWQF